MYLHSVDVAVGGEQAVDPVEDVLAVADDARVAARVQTDGPRDRLDRQPGRRHDHLAPRRPVDVVAGRVQRVRRPPLLLLPSAAVVVVVVTDWR